jgi:molybdenum cofactor cytidylyltransferase
VKIGAIVLAAGGSARLGQPKQLLRFRGQSLVRRVVEAAIKAGCSPIAVVLGEKRREIAAALRGLSVVIVPNESWQRGIGSSIRAGVKALKTCDALVILVCDQPHVTADLIRALMHRHEETNRPIIASAYLRTLGVPALFARDCFEKLLSLGDKQGAKSIILTQPDDVARVAFPNGAIDIDTPDDYRNLPNEH